MQFTRRYDCNCWWWTHRVQRLKRLPDPGMLAELASLHSTSSYKFSQELQESSFAIATLQKFAIFCHSAFKTRRKCFWFLVPAYDHGDSRENQQIIEPWTFYAWNSPYLFTTTILWNFYFQFKDLLMYVKNFEHSFLNSISVETKNSIKNE